jgi:heme A synthase
MSVVSENRSGFAPELPGAPRYQPGVHRLAVLLMVWAFIVVSIGGLVKSREGGLSIVQGFMIECHLGWLWPYSADYNGPNLAAEYGHRALVGVMSGITLLVTIAVFLYDRRRGVRMLAVALVGVLFLQAFLGYLTVRYFAHAPTSIPHAFLGQAFLCLAVAMSAVTSRRWLADSPALPAPSKSSAESPSLCRLAVYATIAVGVQLLLGAALRHDDQGLALRSGRTHVFIWHLAAHIAGAFAVVYFVFRMLLRVFHHHRAQTEILRPARLMMMALGVQFLLGPGAAVLKLTTLEDHNMPPLSRVLTATIHLATGALILSLCLLVSLRAYRFTSPMPAGNRRQDHGNGAAHGDLARAAA